MELKEKELFEYMKCPMRYYLYKKGYFLPDMPAFFRCLDSPWAG